MNSCFSFRAARWNNDGKSSWTWRVATMINISKYIKRFFPRLPNLRNSYDLGKGFSVFIEQEYGDYCWLYELEGGQGRFEFQTFLSFCTEQQRQEVFLDLARGNP